MLLDMSVDTAWFILSIGMDEAMDVGTPCQAVIELILGAVIEFSVVDGMNTWQVATGLADLGTTEAVPQACMV
jgi:hypothetical protein